MGEGIGGGMGCLVGKDWNSRYIHVWCNVGMVECWGWMMAIRI